MSKKMKSKEERAKDIYACKTEVARAMSPILDKYEIMDVDLLSMLAYMVGETIALMDKNTVSPQTAMAQVMLNIELGNMAMVNALTVPPGIKRN